MPPDRRAREEVGLSNSGGGDPGRRLDHRQSARPREEEGPYEENKKATALGRRSAPPRHETGLGEEDRDRFRDYLP